VKTLFTTEYHKVFNNLKSLLCYSVSSVVSSDTSPIPEESLSSAKIPGPGDTERQGYEKRGSFASLLFYRILIWI
ncbi:hypothetical protein, partial [Bacteroides fragilis]|uniref:hypothetical protein n=1 Tax=Bacteroides fragilis TaxID=817 RepID=UPI0011125A92